MQKILLNGMLVAGLVACGQPSVRNGADSDAEALTQGATPAQFKKFDANGDDKLDATEVPADIWQILVAADADNDGGVTLDEIVDALINGLFKKPHGKGHHPHCPPFWKLDADGDGAITQPEAAHFWPELVQADADGDGKVSETEIKAAIAAGVFAGPPPREFHVAFDKLDADANGTITKAEAGDAWGKIEVADKDQNGEVTEAEFDAAVAAGALVDGEHEDKGPSGASGSTGSSGATGKTGDSGASGDKPEIFAKFDSNGDGFLEKSEVPEELWTKKLSKADADADGKVSLTEWKAFLAAQP